MTSELISGRESISLVFSEMPSHDQSSVAAAIIMSLVYGHDISPTNDYYVGLAEAAVGKLSESIFPGANAVNAIPALRYLPAWFPGAGFKRFSKEVKNLTDQMLNVPLKLVESKIVRLTPCPFEDDFPHSHYPSGCRIFTDMSCRRVA